MTGADPHSLRVSFGPPEIDLGSQKVRHRRFYIWTEGGQKFGSWTWQSGHPPVGGNRVGEPALPE